MDKHIIYIFRFLQAATLITFIGSIIFFNLIDIFGSLAIITFTTYALKRMEAEIYD